jgi:hypothetical protein
VRVYDATSGATLLEISGATLNDFFGDQAAFLTDVNGDAIPDLAVSSPRSDDFGPDAGKITVHSGANGAILYTIAPPSWCPNFGSGSETGSMVAVPDMDGDMISDLAVGCYAAIDPQGNATGAVAFFSGSNGNLLNTWWGSLPGEEFGNTLTRLRDLPNPGDESLGVAAVGGQGRVDVFVLNPPTILATASTYGAGCGTPTLDFTPTSNPITGTAGSALISNAPTSVGGVAMGFNDTFLGGLPILPLDLASIGMAGCDLLHSNEVFGLPVTPLTSSTMQFDYAIPSHAGLLGVHVYLQAYCLAPSANPLQIIASNGIDWLIGNQ